MYASSSTTRVNGGDQSLQEARMLGHASLFMGHVGCVLYKGDMIIIQAVKIVLSSTGL